MKWFFFLLPWMELYSLIKLGGNIGAFGALAWVFLTVAVGLSIMRLQGMEVLRRLQEAQAEGFVAGRLLADEMAMGLAGLLLVVPGLITDSLALIVLIWALLRRLLGRGPTETVIPTADSHGHGHGHETLEGEYRRLDPD